MTINMVPLDAKQHKHLYIKPDKSYAHITNQNMVPLVAAEFLQASTNFPIVFVKQQETGQFKSIALLGLEANENIIFSNGQIHSSYIPVNVRRYPFAAGNTENEQDNIILCIDENSVLLNEKEGVQIFDEQGQPTAATKQVTELLIDLLAKDEATDHFIAFLVEHDLLHGAELTLKLGKDGDRKINGIYKIDEQALNQLSDEVALQLYKRKYFAAIYAHLASLSQFNRLLALKAEQDKKA